MTHLIARIKTASLLKEIAQLLFGVGLLYASTQVKIPWGIVPITMQTTAVLLIGLTYAPRLAITTLAVYLGMGFVGVNVFTAPGALWGPTGGYLVGFLAAATALSFLKQKLAPLTSARLIGLCLLGLGILYTMGVVRLATLIGLTPALEMGLFPFIIPELLKSAALVALVRLTHLNLKSFGK